MIVATLYGYIDIVKSLLDKGANKGKTNLYCRSAVIISETPWEDLKGVYRKLEKGLNVKFDYERINNTRSIISEMLMANS